MAYFDKGYRYPICDMDCCRQSGANKQQLGHELWKVCNVYQFLIDEDTKIAYPLNRYYKNLGNLRTTIIRYPDGAKNGPYMYNDETNPSPYRGTPRSKLLKLSEMYSAEIARIEQKYTVQCEWDYGFRDAEPPDIKEQVFDVSADDDPQRYRTSDDDLEYLFDDIAQATQQLSQKGRVEIWLSNTRTKE